jgi:hypothetical protein
VKDLDHRVMSYLAKFASENNALDQIKISQSNLNPGWVVLECQPTDPGLDVLKATVPVHFLKINGVLGIARKDDELVKDDIRQLLSKGLAPIHICPDSLVDKYL